MHTGNAMDGSTADGGQIPCLLSSLNGGKCTPIGKQIFCSRSLNTRNAIAVGFEMDSMWRNTILRLMNLIHMKALLRTLCTISDILLRCWIYWHSFHWEVHC